MWPPFLYPPPSSVYVAAMSAVSLVSMANAGLAELRGKHMAYSKFWHVVAAGAGGGADTKQRSGGGGGGAILNSRDGMLVAYVPALAAAVASFAVPGAVDGERAQILAAALAAHFLKRVLEVLFVHRYSGSMPVDTAVTIGTSYLLSTANMIYAQHLSHGLPDPPVDLLYPGVAVFAVGIAGNFYHHYLLSKLRSGGGGGSSSALVRAIAARRREKTLGEDGAAGAVGRTEREGPPLSEPPWPSSSCCLRTSRPSSIRRR